MKRAEGNRRDGRKKAVWLAVCMAAGLTAGILTMRLSGGEWGQEAGGWQSEKDGHEITVIARESGSGTRSSFHEQFGLWQETEKGRMDAMTGEAVIVNRSGAMLAAVAGNPYAIGYGSAREGLRGVKLLKIDGVAPDTEAIRDGSYPYIRFFFLAVRKEEGQGLQFLRYVLSEEGQEIVQEAGYLEIARTEGRQPDEQIEENLPQKLVLAGSSSVAPLALLLAEGYERKEPGLKRELQENDSGTGMRMLLAGNADAALLSRELTEEEKEQVCWAAIAADGIAVYVNEENPTDSLSVKDIQEIYLGRRRVWE